jgi:hypothetical protein
MVIWDRNDFVPIYLKWQAMDLPFFPSVLYYGSSFPARVSVGKGLPCIQVGYRQPPGNEKSDGSHRLDHENNVYTPSEISHTNLFSIFGLGASGSNRLLQTHRKKVRKTPENSKIHPPMDQKSS